jgi:hypothetical protein
MARLRERIGKKVLRRKFRGANREIRVHNFDTARSAVILFDTSTPDSFPVIRDFRKFMGDKGVKCSVFGYVQQKEVPQELLFRKNFSFITRNELNWYLKPRGEAAEAFYALDPDLLIDFTQELPLELQFLVQLSPARFKVGCFTEEENDYDLMISLSEQKEIGYLAEQFKHYISMLNPVN